MNYQLAQKYPVELVPYDVKPEPVSVEDTLKELNISATIREFIAGANSWRQEDVINEVARANREARMTAQATEHRLKELAALYQQRCGEKEEVEKRLSGSQALEEPGDVGERLTQLSAFDRVISDLLDLIEEQREIATKAKLRAERFEAIEKLVMAIARRAAPEVGLAQIFGVEDPLSLLPRLTRGVVMRQQTEAREAEVKRQAEYEQARELGRQRDAGRQAEDARKRAEIDGMTMEEIAGMFFTAGGDPSPLRAVTDAINGGVYADRGLRVLEAFASDPELFLVEPRRYALDRLLAHFRFSTYAEYQARKYPRAAEVEPLTPENIASSSDWRKMIPLAFSGEADPQMVHYFMGGCVDGRGDYLIQNAVETMKSRSELGKAAILRLNELAQLTRMKRAA